MSNFEEVIKKIKILRYEKILLETKLSNITFIQSPSFNERIAGGLKKDIEEKYAEYSELLRKIITPSGKKNLRFMLGRKDCKHLEWKEHKMSLFGQ